MKLFFTLQMLTIFFLGSCASSSSPARTPANTGHSSFDNIYQKIDESCNGDYKCALNFVTIYIGLDSNNRSRDVVTSLVLPRTKRIYKFYTSRNCSDNFADEKIFTYDLNIDSVSCKEKFDGNNWNIRSRKTDNGKCQNIYAGGRNLLDICNEI